MTYARAWKPPRPSSEQSSGQLILSVGRHAYLHLPPSGEETGDFTPFGWEAETSQVGELQDGQEVEIIAWRPAAGGHFYQVRRISDCREWWARATCLRVAAVGTFKAL